MKIQKLSLCLGSLGIFTILIYTYKYFIVSDFTGMWLIGCGVGLGALFGSYMYSWMKDVDEKIKKVNERVDAFSKWFIKNKELKDNETKTKIEVLHLPCLS